MNKYISLFEKQSYMDALDFYLSSLDHSDVPVWDYVILTSSNESQAQTYRAQIADRFRRHWLSPRTQYAVIPDPEGKRVGSGGATLSCIRYVAEREGTLIGKKILVIHSGGDSRRVPQYSACGKLFSPVPRILPGGRRSTLFDEYMIGMSTVAGRIPDGMLVCSGDVLLLFNALQIDFYGSGAAALSMKVGAEVGKDHGVYLGDADGNVGSFLHKQSVETLQQRGAVDQRGRVNVDTGAVILRSDLLQKLYQLVDTEEKYHEFVNERARLSFYADFLYPMASGSTIEQFYREQPEGEFTEELRRCRTSLWDILSRYRMKLICLSPASFIHFGTTRELLHLMTDGLEEYRFLGWTRAVNTNIVPRDFSVSNSYVSRHAVIGAGSYIEDSRIHRNSIVGRSCVISGVTLSGDSVPDETVLHGLKLKDGHFVCRMYRIDDNPKESSLFGKKLSQPLWTARIYPVCGTIEDAVRQTLVSMRNFLTDGDTCPDEEQRISLKESFDAADGMAILPWQENLLDQVTAEAILEHIHTGVSAEDDRQRYPHITEDTIQYLVREAEGQNLSSLPEFSERIRIGSYLWKLTGDRTYLDQSLRSINAATIQAAGEIMQYSPSPLVKEKTVVRLPVRVNWGGGWSDTPPYCMEHGGTVLNAAIRIRGRLPIEVTVRKLDRPVVALASTDIGSYREFRDLSELRDCRNPLDPFALHKAALIACGIVPEKDNVSTGEFFHRLGGGLYLNTRVIDIPKGSGLGTSSILAGACVKALYESMGLPVTDREVFSHVLCIEQLMSTGGGWQDQVGGIVPGIKMIRTTQGLKQEILVKTLNLRAETLRELEQRFALIYTGQRRLARNLLRDVVGSYLNNNPSTVEALETIQQLAVLMEYELEKGNIDGFAKLLNRHWEASQKIDAESTNTCIDQIFATIDDLIDGRMICGAGGGGFLQVILKKGVSRDMLRMRLDEVFQDSGVDVWESTFVMPEQAENSSENR